MTVSLRRLPVALLAAFLLSAGAASAEAQTVTQADIDRLDVIAGDIQADLTTARSRNAGSSDMEGQLSDLRDEITYLKVKQRKGERISRGDFDNLRMRLETLRGRARSAASGISGGMAGATPAADRNRTYADNEIPDGTEIDVRLEQALSSETATVEQRFEATTAADIYQDNDVLIPAGSRVRGIVRTVEPATRTNRRGEMTLAFDQITVNGRAYPMRATLIQALEADKDKEVAKIGGGAGVGAIIGGILGGVKGAILGAVIGAGGTVAATEGSDVKLDAGTILRIRLDAPLVVR